MDNQLEKLLETLPLQSLPIKGFFRNYPVDLMFRSGDFVLLCGTSDYQWAYLFGENPEDLLEVLDQFNNTSLYFANVEDWMLPAITQTRRIEWKLTTHRYYLTDDQPIEAPKAIFSTLDPSLSPTIFNLSAYKDFTSIAYIEDRLRNDVSAGIWQDNTLVGWGLTHDDGSLGFLNVLPSWQGKGLGESILKGLILKKRESNLPVFVNIEPHNNKSLNLIAKLGFTFDRQVSWVKLV
ncbi:MAG TPA: GNAT family N-acetyltransferase [Bacteroidales bacterium]|nr:GNAT family N-acetyltransferase [Bacteroidales bacterium]